MKKIILLALLLSSLFAQIATLVQKEGIVKVKHKDSIKKESLKINDILEKGDTIYTYNSIAVIKLKDNSIIKLTPYSELKLNENKVSQKKGEIYFNIKKRKLHKLQVATAFTTIGVKGTIFIVNDNQIHFVALKKGLLAFKALKGKYEIHKSKLIQEFNDEIKKQEREFKNYKNQLYKEFIEYKAEFKMKENNIVSFNGNKVYENRIDKNNLKEFNKFENEFKLSSFNYKTNVSQNKENSCSNLKKDLNTDLKISNKNSAFDELDEE
jgi:hypothetical protein